MGENRGIEKEIKTNIAQGGAQFAWSSYHTLAPLIIGAAGLLGWVAYEHYVPKVPMIPLGILRTRTAAAAFITTMIYGIIQAAVIYYLPLYFEAAKGYSPLITGVAMVSPQHPRFRFVQLTPSSSQAP